MRLVFAALGSRLIDIIYYKNILINLLKDEKERCVFFLITFLSFEGRVYVTCMINIPMPLALLLDLRYLYFKLSIFLYHQSIICLYPLLIDVAIIN